MESEELESYMISLIISVNRLYDIGLLLYAEYAGEEAAQFVRNLHKQGKLWAPPPFEFEDTDEQI